MRNVGPLILIQPAWHRKSTILAKFYWCGWNQEKWIEGGCVCILTHSPAVIGCPIWRQSKSHNSSKRKGICVLLIKHLNHASQELYPMGLGMWRAYRPFNKCVLWLCFKTSQKNHDTRVILTVRTPINQPQLCTWRKKHARHTTAVTAVQYSSLPRHSQCSLASF